MIPICKCSLQLWPFVYHLFFVSKSPHLWKNNHIEIAKKNCLAIYNWYTKGLNCIINLSNNLCTQLGSTVKALYIQVIKGLNWLYMGLYYFTNGVSTDICIYIYIAMMAVNGKYQLYMIINGCGVMLP